MRFAADDTWPASPDLNLTPARPRRRERAAEAPTARKAYEFQAVPLWARADLSTHRSEASAFLAAGASLVLLDGMLRQDMPFAGALRQRLALRAAVASAKILRLREDEGALRDAEHLAVGLDPGIAGRLHRFWRTFAGPGAHISAPRLDEALALLDHPDADQGQAIADRIDGLEQAADPVSAAAAAATAVYGSRQQPEDEILAFWIADCVLAARLGWNRPVPLLMTRALEPALRRGEAGRRPRPGDATWSKVAAQTYALAASDACTLVAQLARRAQQLIAVKPKLRAKCAARVVDLLLADDCVSAARAAKTAGLSDRAARRLFERLVELDAIQEISGRPSFRLYGL